MAVMSNILLKDDATTPVEYTFIPISDNPLPNWRTSLASVPFEGQMRLSKSVEKQKNGNYKVTVKLEVPVMETLGASGTSGGYVAPPKVAYVTTAILSMFVDKRSTIADRANILKMLGGIISGASAATGTGIATNASAGDGWKGMTAPGPFLFTNLVLPS